MFRCSKYAIRGEHSIGVILKLRPAPKPQLQSPESECSNRSSEIAVQEIVGRFQNCGPADKSGPEQRKLRRVQSSRAGDCNEPCAGGRAAPNEDVKLSRGAFYRLLRCLY